MLRGVGKVKRGAEKPAVTGGPSSKVRYGEKSNMASCGFCCEVVSSALKSVSEGRTFKRRSKVETRSLAQNRRTLAMEMKSASEATVSFAVVGARGQYSPP